VQESIVETDQDFWISVFCEFEIKEQLTSLIRILQYLMTLPQDNEDGKNYFNEMPQTFSSEEQTFFRKIIHLKKHTRIMMHE